MLLFVCFLQNVRNLMKSVDCWNSNIHGGGLCDFVMFDRIDNTSNDCEFSIMVACMVNSTDRRIDLLPVTTVYSGT